MKLEFTTLEDANGVPDPKHIWADGDVYRVYTDEDIPEVSAAPIRLNAAQMRLALNAEGLLGTVETMIAAGSKELQIYWEYSRNFESDHPLVVEMATQLGQDIRPIFILGESF
jgi:hypothetical protein